jgi:hypothetical protein
MRRRPRAILATSTPATRAVPDVGASRVARTRSVVVLPAPFGPRRPKISPSRHSRSRPESASTRPRFGSTKTLRSPIASTAFDGIPFIAIPAPS